MNLIELSKEEYKGYELKFEYETDCYYKVNITKSTAGFNVSFFKENYDSLVSKSFEDDLFPDYLDNASAYGIFVDESLIAVLEVNRELYSKRLRVTSILVEKEYRRKKMGKLLMDKAKEIAGEEGLRAIILETQTCNTKAIDFYLSQGFELGGFDKSCYSNDDILKNEVRIELVYFT
ncbi:GNAT family N-acetyltransferase [Mycoplasmatota bacterium]|nr:GNAT family N-acetyltransferase [Mycoplasmatota bacterium]